MEEEKFTIRIELVDIVESKLGIEYGYQKYWKWFPQNWIMDFHKTGKFTSYIMKYGIDWNIISFDILKYYIDI